MTTGPYTYKHETRHFDEFVILDAEGRRYATAPADWSEADVAAAVVYLNEAAQAEAALRAELGDEGYSAYRRQNEAG
jgi:hypothetical protein